MKIRTIRSIIKPSNIDGLIPGVRGQRAFPTTSFKDSDPFLMLDHIGPQVVGNGWKLDGTGHDHPHRGFETITFMFEGRMDHRDSLGNEAQLLSGSAQRMNAGSGIIHGGDMAADPETGRFHEVQLWINNPKSKKMSTPDIHNVGVDQVPSTISDNVEFKVFAGQWNGLKGPLKTKALANIAHLKANDLGSIHLNDIPKNHHMLIYLLEGTVKIDGKRLEEFELIEFNNDGDSVTIQAERGTQALILSGKPLNEPIAFGGPFVMNTQEEIHQAQYDYQQGKFGSIQ